VIAREAQAAVALFARATRVTIEVSPEDAPIVAESMPQLSAALPEGATVSIVARAEIARGGCVVRSSEGTVDARIETQFRRMREGLFGADAPDATSADATSAADNNASTTDSVEPPASDAGEDRS
jgi:flagellar biosynthesis/type III secretory pathway protein FliH